MQTPPLIGWIKFNLKEFFSYGLGTMEANKKEFQTRCQLGLLVEVVAGSLNV